MRLHKQNLRAKYYGQSAERKMQNLIILQHMSSCNYHRTSHN